METECGLNDPSGVNMGDDHTASEGRQVVSEAGAQTQDGRQQGRQRGGLPWGNRLPQDCARTPTEALRKGGVNSDDSSGLF